MRNNLEVSFSTKGRYATDLFTEKAVETINKHSENSNDPLFMMITHVAPHIGNDRDPMQAPEKEINKFKYIQDKIRRIYAAKVSKLDEGVGKVVEALERNKMLENSIILFMSDNGSPVEGMM